MKTLGKKGGFELSWSGLIGVILSALILTIGGTAFAQVLIDSGSAKQSFDDFILGLEALEEGQIKSFTVELPKDYFIVSFSSGFDFKGEQGFIADTYEGNQCDVDIDIPTNLCGTKPCLCLCQQKYFGTQEESCVYNAITCKTFDDASLIDDTCNYGVYREGPSGGLISVTAIKESNFYRLCANKECIAEEHEEVIESFEQQIASYKSCQENSGDCYCDIDLDFLGEEYALKFTNDRIQLWRISSNSPIAEEEFDPSVTTLTSTDPNNVLDEATALYLHNVLVEAYLEDSPSDGNVKYEEEKVVLSPTPETIDTRTAVLSQYQVPTSNRIYHKDGEMAFTEESYLFAESIASCSETTTSSFTST